METYDYSKAGFNTFLTKSLDDQLSSAGGISPNSLEASALGVVDTTQELNFDQSPTTGALGSSLALGNILLDGVTGRISITDENGNEVVRIGDLGD